MNLSAFSISRPITTVMVALSIVVLGAISLFRLPLEYLPDISFPVMYINVSYPSSSPEEIERAITRPLEEVMGTLSHVKAMSSRSFDSSCYVRLEFELGIDMDLMAVHVRDRLDQVRNELPDDLERISIRRWNTEDFPILTYALTWQGPDQSELANVYNYTILPRLQRLEGVGSVEIEGLEEKDLLVEVDQNLLNAHSLDIRALSRTIRANNVNVSAGYVNSANRRLAVRSIGEFDNVQQIRQLPLRNNIQMSDVANVSYDYPEKKSFERLDGNNAVSVDIRKSSTANLVATADRVKLEMERLRAEIGPNLLRVQNVRDRSVDVTDGITSLTQSAMIGGCLAILVIFVFLRNFRSTLIIGSAIPISALSVFMFMYVLRQFFGLNITLNLMSMMGLMVAVGMLVDPAVVTLENIYRKRYEEGQTPWTAALEGSREVGVPVLAASLTTICVFVPIIFVTDSRSSLFMRDFALTVCISVIASLCIALSLIPLAASRAFGTPDSSQSQLDRWLKIGLILPLLSICFYQIYETGLSVLFASAVESLTWFISGIADIPAKAWILVGLVLGAIGTLYRLTRRNGLKHLYARIVNTTLYYRWTTVAISCGVLALGYYFFTKVETQPYRWQPTRRVDLTVEVPRSYDVDDALALFEQVEKRLLPHKTELDIEAVSTRFSNRWSNRITLYLVPADEGNLTTDQVQRNVLARMPKDIPGVRFKSGRTWGSNSTGAGVEIKGHNTEVLGILAEDIRMRMQGIPGVHDVEVSSETGTEEIRVTVNRQRAQRYGLSPQQIATTIATALGTRGNSKFKTEEGEIDIAVQLKEADRATLEKLKNAQFESDTGTLVSFASLADFHLQKGPQAIERENRMSTVTVFANTEQSAVFSVGREMSRRMEAIPLPAAYSWQMDRRFRWMNQEQGQTNFTMLFAAVLVYLIMAALFESYVHPFTIMFSICFAFIGVSMGLYAFQIPMDSNATYGLLILFGIVVNNGIVLVDHVNRYRRQGLFRRDAIILGGQDRLRPILMTATTTILGLTPLVLPMIYGTAEGTARRWGPIGFVVISGLMVSTLLTLVLLPTVYSLMDDLSGYVKRVAASAEAR
ncbi:MAG: efflux RND transporter permease subunit [bacterium]|nr:efflux RND transporter permease subunit [bacterium]